MQTYDLDGGRKEKQKQKKKEFSVFSFSHSTVTLCKHEAAWSLRIEGRKEKQDSELAALDEEKWKRNIFHFKSYTTTENLFGVLLEYGVAVFFFSSSRVAFVALALFFFPLLVVFVLRLFWRGWISKIMSQRGRRRRRREERNFSFPTCIQCDTAQPDPCNSTTTTNDRRRKTFCWNVFRFFRLFLCNFHARFTFCDIYRKAKD